MYDTIDLTGNEIKVLANFPRLSRLGSLFLSNNSISRIDAEFFSPAQLPRLHTLILTENRLIDLGDLEPLSAFQAAQLKHLSFLDNPVVKKPHYRLFVISRLPGLKTLDFKRVKKAELEQAKKMFGSEAESKAKVFEIGETEAASNMEPEAKRRKTAAAGKKELSAEQIEKIQTAIKNAKTLAEINRLEKILQTGHVPDEKDLKYLEL